MLCCCGAAACGAAVGGGGGGAVTGGAVGGGGGGAFVVGVVRVVVVFGTVGGVVLVVTSSVVVVATLILVVVAIAAVGLSSLLPAALAIPPPINKAATGRTILTHSGAALIFSHMTRPRVFGHLHVQGPAGVCHAQTALGQRSLNNDYDVRGRMFEKRKARKAAQQAVRAAEQATKNAEEWQKRIAICEQRLEAARSFDGVEGLEAEGCPIPLKPGERMYCMASGAVLVEPRRSGGHWQGASQGVSVHVPGTKSMRYRVGSTRGTYVQGTEVPTPIDEGSFTVTSQRAVFVGAKASREWQWAKLLGVTHASDAPWIAIAVSNRQKTSGVACDSENIEAVRFWIDLAIANSVGSRDVLVHDLEEDLAEQRRAAGFPS